MNKNKELKLKQSLMKLAQQKKYAEARSVALKLLKAFPKDIELLFALAQLQEHLGEFEAAVRSYYKVCDGPSSRYVAAVERSVMLCLEHKMFTLGLAPARALIKLKPNSSGAYFNLGYFWFELKQYMAAEPYMVKASDLDPDNAVIKAYCGQIYTFIAQPEKAISYLEQNQKLKIDDMPQHGSYVMTHNYVYDISEDAVYKAHCSYAKKVEQKYPHITPLPSKKSSRPERLKVGYCSADFKFHSVASFFKAMIEGYSKDTFEIFCYSDVEKSDEMTSYIKGLSDHWCDSKNMSDEQLFQRVRDDQIDILVDLMGYTGTNRLGVYAQRAAPVQVTYLGYPNTTGLVEMDYRITDEWSDPKGRVEAFYTESLQRLPGGFLCFTPSDEAPDLSLLPALKEGAKGVCFGSFNAFHKISPQLLKIWAKVLLAVPNSTLYMKTKPLQEKALCEKVWETFEAEGVARDRVELSGWAQAVASHLECYDKVDIHLDSYPYNGTTTLCESFWQGVPAISLAGESHRSRVGLSLLTQLDLASYVATSEQEYIDIAIRVSEDLDALGDLRKNLRERMRQSSLMDRTRFISELEDAYENMWEQKALS